MYFYGNILPISLHEYFNLNFIWGQLAEADMPINSLSQKHTHTHRKCVHDSVCGVINSALSVPYSVLVNQCCIGKNVERSRCGPFDVQAQHFPGGIEEDSGRWQSRQIVSWTRFTPATSQIQVRIPFLSGTHESFFVCDIYLGL